MWLLALLIALPLIEIALFIQIGGWLTLWPSLAIVVGTALLGLWLLRNQGLRTVAELQRSAETLRDPVAPLAHGAMIFLAGVLLLLPGFLTDSLGLILLVPPIRTLLLAWVMRNGWQRVVIRAGARRRPADDIIDADFADVTPRPGRPSIAPGVGDNDRGPSGWTRH